MDKQPPEPDALATVKEIRQSQVPIDAAENLWLTLLGDTIAEDDANFVTPQAQLIDRFTRVFRDTWQRVPTNHRRAMQKHWRSVGLLWGDIDVILGPTIYLIDAPPSKDIRSLALCDRGGCRLQFRAEVVDRMPVAQIAELIAHELAHVLQEPDGRGLVPRIDQENDEHDADLRMESWGFNTAEIDVWVKQHVLEFSPELGRIRWRSEPLSREQAIGLLMGRYSRKARKAQPLRRCF